MLSECEAFDFCEVKGEIIMKKKISWKNAVEYGGILAGAFLTVKYPATVYVLFLILWGIRNL